MNPDGLDFDIRLYITPDEKFCLLQPIIQQDFGDCCSLVKDTLSLQHHVSHLWDEDDKIDFINRLKNNVVAELNLSENPVNELVDLLHVNFCETLKDDNTRIRRYSNCKIFYCCFKYKY